MVKGTLTAVVLGAVCGGAAAAGPPSVPYRVPAEPWPEGLGLHRAVVSIDSPADAVAVRLPWRRRDDPARKQILIIDSAGTRIRNVFRISVQREQAELVFGPVTAAGRHFIYYMPFPVQPGWGGYGGNYLPPEPAPNTAWVAAHHLTRGMALGAGENVEQAELVCFEARTEFDSVFPMEIPVTSAEMQGLLDRHPAPVWLFPEDRRYPIRMAETLPTRWLSGPAQQFAGEAMRNEYFVFQVGVFAARQDVQQVALAFSDLHAGKATLPADRLTCFNLGGIDAYARPFTKSVSVAKGLVQALWIGIDVPADATPGRYHGTVTVSAANLAPIPVSLELTVRDQLLPDRGDGDLWRHARLRWLNSTRGIADTPVLPYTPVKLEAPEPGGGPALTLGCLGRRVMIAADGLPAQLQSFGGEVLAAPMRLVVETDAGLAALTGDRPQLQSQTPETVAWETTWADARLSLRTRGTLEADGYLHYHCLLSAKQDTVLKDVRLEIPFRPDTAQYTMGMGCPGEEVPEHHEWTWRGPQDSFWMGNAGAGLHCELRGSSYHGPMLNLYHPKPPASWYNRDRGGYRFSRSPDRVLATVYSGERKLSAGQEIDFEFALIVTPVKPLDPARQFRERYYHSGGAPSPEGLEAGVKIINVHHGNALNPFINYPFVPEATERLRAFVDHWHAQGMKVKLYYTLRELTNHVAEIWALRSLGDEVLAGGNGGGYPWLREHLRTGYTPQWYHHFDDGTVCAALKTSGETRWYNYYIEGLAWLVKNVGIDGLYLDDVSYDRRILKRMRRVMAEEKAGCVIDLHSNTAFSIGPATQYTEFFPYVDKLWFGESFHYNQMSPAAWLVECSGIPFGLMGDMLQGGGNRWLGMVYGMTVRMPWTGAYNPRPIWRIWDEFGIEKAAMRGYWDPACPVRTDRDDVLATAYVRPGKTLLAVGSWAPEKVEVHLAVDWAALGLDPNRVRLHAPPVDDYQPAAQWEPNDPIPVLPRRGWLILADEAHATPAASDSAAGPGRTLFRERFAGGALAPPWRPVASKRPGTSLAVADGALKITATAHSVAFVERPLPVGVAAVQCHLHTGSDKGESWGSGLLLAWAGQRTLRINIRATEHRFGIDDGTNQWFAGSAAPNALYGLRILLRKDEVLLQANTDNWLWMTLKRFPRAELSGDPVVLRVGKMDPAGHGDDYVAPGAPGACEVRSVTVFGQ